jgi:hypothetical protein
MTPRWPGWIALATVVIFGWSSRATACDVPNGNDQISDWAAIQCLLDLGETVALDADSQQFGYYIDQPLVLRKNGTTLTGTSAVGNRAMLYAMPQLDANGGGPILQIDSAVTRFTIRAVWFYGNRSNRPSPVCADDRAANLWLRGSGAFPGDLLLDNIESDQVPCQTSMNIDARNFEIGNSWFAFNNGDAITAWRCDHGYIHHNHFRDNEDVDIISGGGAGCRVEDNDIQHNFAHGWVGVMVGRFIQGGGDHTGSTFLRNIISSGLNLLSFGILVGNHPWNVNEDLVNSAGSTEGNRVSGAVLNLTVEASQNAQNPVAGSVQGNTVSGHQGTNGWAGCQWSFDYTVFVPHAGTITLQPGWTDFQFDSLVCTPQ